MAGEYAPAPGVPGIEGGCERCAAAAARYSSLIRRMMRRTMFPLANSFGFASMSRLPILRMTASSSSIVVYLTDRTTF